MAILAPILFCLCFCGAIVGGIRTTDKKPGGRLLLWTSLAIMFLMAVAFVIGIVQVWNAGKFDI